MTSFGLSEPSSASLLGGYELKFTCIVKYSECKFFVVVVPTSVNTLQVDSDMHYETDYIHPLRANQPSLHHSQNCRSSSSLSHSRKFDDWETEKMGNIADEFVAWAQLVIAMSSYSAVSSMSKRPMLMLYLEYLMSFDGKMENLKRNLVKSEIVVVYDSDLIGDSMHLVMQLVS